MTVHSTAIIPSWVELGEGVVIHPFAVLGRLPSISKAVARMPKHLLSLRIGDRTEIGPHAVIYGGVEIGADCMIGDFVSIREECHLGDGCLIGRHVSINYESWLSDGVKVMDGTHITGRCTIGEKSFIGVNVTTSNDRHINPDYYRYDPEKVAGPQIGKSVVVGSGANLCAGVVIGDGAFIKAGALVTRDVPAKEKFG